jgi:ABC-type branched-subunit amino acid transport system substrate-binding protein
MEAKIGILLPRSDMFPPLAMDFLNGLKLAFKISGGELFVPKLLIESVGNATGKSLLQTAEKMILQEDVTLVISFCGSFNLKELAGIFSAYKKPLIHADLGGNVLKDEHTNPYVIHHTLNLWQSAYYSGIYAANTLGKDVALAISFYDGGYHLVECFVRGFTENGGNVVYNYVSPMDYKSESFETMVKGLQDANPDLLFMLFSYNEGNKIFDIISKSPLNGKIPLLAAPPMTGEMNNSENNTPDNVFSVSSWAFDEETPAMKSFQTNYSTLYHDAPNVISLLGYEVGLTVFSCFGENQDMPSKIGDFAKSLVIETPRGELTFSRYNESLVQTNKVRQFLSEGNQHKNSIVNTIDLSDQEELYDKFKDLPYSGWQNPYLIT